MKVIAIISLIFAIIVLIVYTILLCENGYLYGGTFSLDNSSKIAPFIGSCVGVFLTFSTTLLIFENLNLVRKNNNQNILLTQKSQFESLFFNLLSEQRSIKQSIDTTVYSPIDKKDIRTKGANFFDDLATGIAGLFVGKPQTREELVKLYNEQFTLQNSDLGHYFRFMYHIVKFVDKNPYFKLIENSQDFLQKSDYLKLLRAQFSNSEITLLALNGMTKQGEAFKSYIDKYKLLVNINFELELNKEDYQTCIPSPDLLAKEYKQLENVLIEQKKVADYLKN